MGRTSYAKAGVDIRKVGSIHRSLAERLEETFTNRKGLAGMPLIPIGHYAGLVDLGGNRALALHTDGVGSKVTVAQQMRKFDTVGIDCVAMTVNDLVCLGAEPIALLDYIALEKEDDELVSELTDGLVEGARLSGTAIVGGETAILGELVKGRGGRGFDLVSMGAALLDKRRMIDGSAIAEGDVILGVESSGLHSNGYTLARKIIAGIGLSKKPPGLDVPLGEALLAPTSIYVKPVLESVHDCEIHGLAHITGGAFSKLTRLVGRRRLGFRVTIPRPEGIFALLQKKGELSDREMYRTFNMGVGFCVVLPRTEVEEASAAFSRHSFDSSVIGEIRRGEGVTVNGTRVA